MRRIFVRTLVLVALAALVTGGAWGWLHRPWRVVARENGVALTARELDLRAQMLGGDQREMARTWIAKQVLLDEAVQRRVTVTDEGAVTNVFAAWLESHGKTWESLFTAGPFPEKEQRQNFQDGLLIHALVKDGLRTASFADFYRSLRAKADVQCSEFPDLEHPDAGAPLYALFWGWPPARVVAVAAGQVLTSAELDLRVQNARDDWSRRGLPPPQNERALRSHEVEFWIYKVVMRAEAARRKYSLEDDDGKINEAMEKEMMDPKSPMSRRLADHKLTVGQFFREGVLPESLKMDDFVARSCIDRFTQSEILGKVNVTAPEIEARMAELRKRAADERARGGKASIRSDRKTAIFLLRHERYVKDVEDFFRSAFSSARVWCPEFPELEQADRIRSPIRFLYESVRKQYPELPAMRQDYGPWFPNLQGGGRPK